MNASLGTTLAITLTIVLGGLEMTRLTVSSLLSRYSRNTMCEVDIVAGSCAEHEHASRHTPFNAAWYALEQSLARQGDLTTDNRE